MTSVAVVGCGSIACNVHLRALARLPDVRVTVLADTDPQRRAVAARLAPHAALVETCGQAVAYPSVDATLICLPTGLHAPAALVALRQRKHLYLEKPLATNLDEARPVLDEWKRASVVGMMGFNYRFNPLFATSRRHLQSNRLGDVLAVRSVFSTPARTIPPWKTSQQSGGGVLLDLASHHFDLLPWLLGREVREVSAMVRSVRSELDTATVELRFDGGVVAQCFFSLSTVNEDRLEVLGTNATLTVDRYRSTTVEITEPNREFSKLKLLRALIPNAYMWQRLRSPGHEPSYLRALGAFIATVRDGKPVQPDLADGFRSLAIVAAAEESARSGRPAVVCL